MEIVKKTEDYSIYISSHKFPDEMCDLAINIFKNINKTNPSRIDNDTTAPKIALARKDKQLFLDEQNRANNFSIDNEVCNEDISESVNSALNIALTEYVEIFESLLLCNLRSTRQKLQKTSVGEGYHIWHFEQTDYSSSDRVLAWTIYLNDVEEGGETEFLYQSKRIKAKKGDICIFPAQFNYAHRGNPPLSGDKYIITGWYILQ
tara:strand:+ start:992 stop:1606 length:615 start_codon:yes stop_codon:yes gene_type:complete